MPPWLAELLDRRRTFRLGLGLAALLFVLSLGISLIRILDQYGAETRTQRNGLWIASQARVEIARLISLLERGAAAGEAAQAGLQFEILLSRIEMLGSPRMQEAQPDMAPLHQHLPGITAALLSARALLGQALEEEDAPALAAVLGALERAEGLLRWASPRFYREEQGAALDAANSLRSLHRTLLACLAGLVGSVALLIVLLLLESRRGRQLLRGAEAASRQREAERALRVLIDALPVMVSAYDDRGRYLYVNDAYRRFHGFGEEGAVIGCSPADLGVTLDAGMRRRLRGQAAEPFAEYQAAGSDGRQRILLATAATVADGPGGPDRVVHVALDIAGRSAAGEQARRLAEHDLLTGLPNRLLFGKRLRQALATARQIGAEGGFALHAIDLDRFKEVNDSLGHQAGDRLLMAAAERMRACLEEGDTLARLGGDEFAVIQRAVSGPWDGARLSARLVAALARPFELNGRTLHSGGSIGSALMPAHGDTAEELLQRADIALCRAKAEGRGRAVIFSPEMEVALVERRALEADLRQALAEEALSLVYQPKFRLGGEVAPIGCEALLRWRHPGRGMVSPALFVPVAEESGLATTLSRFVLRRACEQIRAWQRQGLAIPVAVNLSALHFASDQAVALVDEALAATGVPARLLEVEVTEGVFIRDAQAARIALEELRARGVRVALDDFGTGYSSLSYLQHLPFDVVKVDRAFVQDLLPGGSGVRIVDAIVRLVHGLGAEVVAEGVERQDQLDLLAHLGCDAAQGYLLGRPMPPEHLAALFRVPPMPQLDT
ncbi:putative bifunctional diguanylate cyclase/phosphodiesterase [Roseomonas marmotae]|uniref:EAL domain-containing protein n=1 Tax=Roseomonas marmotae TaxID=2768161 RepID=A0ABS3K9K8_9PROT|nr:EAL domain-containing protein [Roseomonas marmotae]MBO1074143.1 EAL domain-containing protein [Roseomonas marmotae]QTI78922.1 EAL domain-containing protein [Roseomonas marmotae]